MPDNQRILLENPEPLEIVAAKVRAYHTYMKQALLHLNDLNQPVPATRLNLEYQYLQFYIDKDAIDRLVAISEMAEFDSMGVFFGLDDEYHNKLTACFVGLTATKEIIPGHFFAATPRLDDDNIFPEENWPPPPENKASPTGDRPYFTLNSPVADIDKFFLGKP